MQVISGPSSSFAANTPRMAFAGASAPNSAAPACTKTTPKFAASGDSVKFSGVKKLYAGNINGVKINVSPDISLNDAQGAIALVEARGKGSPFHRVHGDLNIMKTDEGGYMGALRIPDRTTMPTGAVSPNKAGISTPPELMANVLEQIAEGI